MRYDTPVYFQHIVPGTYDPATGNYGEDIITETLVYASVMDTRTETKKLIYGDIREGSLTIHIQNHFPDTFSRIRIGDKVYRIDFRRNPRVKESFIVSEVQ